MNNEIKVPKRIKVYTIILIIMGFMHILYAPAFFNSNLTLAVSSFISGVVIIILSYKIMKTHSLKLSIWLLIFLLIKAILAVLVTHKIGIDLFFAIIGLDLFLTIRKLKKI